MNREKKQLVVVGVLVVLVLSVGAFQFTRKDPPPPPSTKTEKAKAKDKVAEIDEQKVKYPELMAMQPKDPFAIASFVAGSNPPEPTPPVQPNPTVGGTKVPKAAKEFNPIPPGDITWNPGGVKPTGEIKPEEPPKPVFGYSLVGIVEGSHPMAVFEDGKGNQRLVETGQSVGSSATVLSISRGKVRVKFNEETLVLNVGGNPNAK
jgi:hypothetical protein